MGAGGLRYVVVVVVEVVVVVVCHHDSKRYCSSLDDCDRFHHSDGDQMQVME